MSAEQNYEFGVNMSCGGCSGAVNRVLGKLDGMLSPPFCHFSYHCLALQLRFFLQSLPLPPLLSLRYEVLYANSPLPTGVKTYDVSLEKQNAVVTTEPTVDFDTVLKKIQGTGKTVLWATANDTVKFGEPPKKPIAA